MQLLSNPHYLHHLSKNNYFKNNQFREYLKYLEYWNTEPYINFLIYPQCLIILEALNNNEEIVNQLDDQKIIEFIDEQLTGFWIWKNADINN